MKIDRIDHRHTRPSCSIRNTLQLTQECAKIGTYLKGGHNACYGKVPYSRGGKPGTAGINRFGTSLDKARGVSGLQGWRRVSHSCRRFQEVHGYPQNHQTRTGTLTIGKLTVLSVAATRSNLSVHQASRNDLARRRYLSSLCHMATLNARWRVGGNP